LKRRPWYFLAIPAGLALFSGGLVAVSLPPRDLSWLGWIALVPLLISTRLVKPIFSAFCGVMAAGMAVRVIVGPCKVPIQCANAVFIFTILAIAFGCVAALASFTAKRLSPRLWAVFVACAGVTLEMATTRLAPASVALSQHRNGLALGIAFYTGIWGVSFLIWLISASIAGLHDKSRSTWLVLAIALLAIPVVGFQALSSRLASASDAPAISVAAVQAPGEHNAAEETAKLVGKPVAALWPEQCLASETKIPADSAKQNNVYVIASVVEYAGLAKPYNRCVVVSPDGKRIGSFRKSHLFGSEIRYYTPGKGSRPVDCGEFEAGVAICFDACFPDVTRNLAREGAQVLFVPSFDPEMPGAAFNHLHGAMIQFRSAENDIPVVWADANSMSTIFDHGGRIVVRAPEREITSVTGKVHLRTRTTFYTRHGDWLVWLSVFGTLVLFGVSLFRKTATEATPLESPVP
jgi:apolipoprotein N-acyltransferase